MSWLELYNRLREQAFAPPKRRTRPETEPEAPPRPSPRRRRKRNPLKPEPGIHPKPKAEDDGETNGHNPDLELFKKVRM